MIFELFIMDQCTSRDETLPNLYQTLLQTFDKNTFRQVLANKNDFAAPGLRFRPLAAQIAAHGLMYALKEHLARRAFHPQHPFVAQHAWTVDFDQAAEKFFQSAWIEGAFAAKNKCGDVIRVAAAVMMRVVMAVVIAVIIAVIVMVVIMIMRFSFQKIRINIQALIKIEAADIENFRDCHLAEICV